MYGNKHSSEAHFMFCSHLSSWWYGHPDRESFVYLLGILKNTRAHIKDIFDFETDTIHPECLREPWVDALARRTMLLAFNLYKNWMPTDYPEDCSPGSLFDNDKLRQYLLIGLQMRYEKKDML